MRSTLHPLASIALLALPVAATRAQAPTRAAVVARIDSIVNASLPNIAGVQVAVVKGRDTLVLRSYGSANIELGVPLTSDHVMRIGSLTKQFTAAAIMQLVEQGKVRLDDPISKYLANTPPAWSGVTVHHLLTHTSGTQSFTELTAARRQIDLMGPPPDSMVQLMARSPMMFDPGTGFYYNNGGYYMLGLILEKASGRSYREYIAQMVAPLGLERTRYCDVPPLIPGRVAGYNRAASGYTNAAYIDMSVPFAGGSLCSTARDLVKWADALASGRVVQPATFRQMTTPFRYESVRPSTYGMGLVTDTLGGRPAVWHNGALNGFSASLLRIAADSLVVAVTTNTAGARATPMAHSIARAVIGVAEPRAQLVDLPVTDAERRALVGRYTVNMADGTRDEMILADVGGRLMLTLARARQTFPLHRQSAQAFEVPGLDDLTLWVDMRGGVVREIIFDRSNRPLVGRPVR